MNYKVRLVDEAESDIVEILNFLLDRESQAQSDKVAIGLEQAIRSLEKLPRRGHTPPELEGLGLDAIAEIHFKPYRIIYEISGHEIIVSVVADMRRDLQDLLTRRVLR